MTHIFRVEAAEKFGLFPAVVLGMVAYFVSLNEANNEHRYEGKHWVRISPAAFEKMYPYATTKQIRGAIEKLIEAGAMEKGYFNASRLDRTAWYTVTESGKEAVDYGQLQFPKLKNPNAQKGKSVVNYPNNSINTQIYETLNLKTKKEIHTPKGVCKEKRQKAAFHAPALEEVREYVEREGLNMSAEAFYDYYMATGWKMKNGMLITDYKAAARNWARMEDVVGKRSKGELGRNQESDDSWGGLTLTKDGFSEDN